MICDHPQCTGNHRNVLKSEMCPRAYARRMARNAAQKATPAGARRNRKHVMDHYYSHRVEVIARHARHKWLKQNNRTELPEGNKPNYIYEYRPNTTTKAA